MKRWYIAWIVCWLTTQVWAEVRVVYHLSDGVAQASRAMNNIRNHLDADPTVKIVVVAHGAGLDFLLDGATGSNGQPFAGTIADLANKGVRFAACNNTLQTRNISRDRLFPRAWPRWRDCSRESSLSIFDLEWVLFDFSMGVRMLNKPLIMRTAALALVCVASFSAKAQAPDPLQVRSWAAGCANCHGTNGQAQPGMVSLAGVSQDDIVRKMQDYKAGRLPATLMHQLSKGYSDEQIVAIAGYFAAQKK